MSWRWKLSQTVEVILRVPPLFIIDSILNGTFLLPWIPQDVPVIGLTSLAWLLFNALSVMSSVTVFVLPRGHLFDAYNILLSMGILGASFWYNNQYITQEYTIHDDPAKVVLSAPSTLWLTILMQLILAYCYNNLTVDHNRNCPSRSLFCGRLYTGRLTYLWFLQSTICCILKMPPNVVKVSPYLSLLLLKGIEAQGVTTSGIQEVVQLCRLMYHSIVNVIRIHGVHMFVETHWIRLHVPIVLRVFWLMRTAYQFVYLYVSKIHEHEELSYHLTTLEWREVCHLLLVSGCETITSLLGMTSIVSFLIHHLGLLFVFILQLNYDDDRNMGTLAAILFFILALQTGLTGLNPGKRLVRLYRNFCLLSTAILHFVHGMVHPQLMNLSAAQSMSAMKHTRALIVCAALIGFPIGLLYYLWNEHSLSTWLLAVTAFSIEVIIKVIISLLVYGLFMFDAYQEQFWEKLDDYVYYIKATGNSIEFLFGIFLFCNGAWIMLFESGGMIRALMMGIHAYFNIWVQAHEGWKVFMKRRTAVNKINSLPMASPEELTNHNDVCAICYQELQSARLTQCRHMFHGVCLRKWLYVQDKCPLCHEPIYQTAAQASEREDVDGGVVEANGLLIHPHED